MKRTIKQWVGALAMVGVLVPMFAEAGWQATMAACSKAADGSGWCYGSFLAFRTHSDPGTFVSFVEYASGSKLFQAWWPTTGSVSCVPNAAVLALWGRALAHEGYFNLWWDASGTCTELILNNGSHHSNY